MYGDSGYEGSGYGQYGPGGQPGYGQYGSGQYGSSQYGYDPYNPGPYGHGAQPGEYGVYGEHGYGPGYGPGGYGEPPRPPRRHTLLTHLLVALLAAGVAAAAVLVGYHPSAGGSGTGVSMPGNSVPQPGASGPATAPSGGGVTNATERAVIDKVEPGLVYINTTLTYDSEAAAGTGMVINSDGLVLTNNHVIEGATKITATVASTGRSYSATVVGYDKTGDVALIKLQDASGLRTVPIGNSSSVKTGTPVVAMGNAEGQSEITPATGQVTGVNQTITASDEGGTATKETLHGMIETNADVVSGDSGGPLATTAGYVIGMDTAGNSVSVPQQTSATGFAIPINTALSVARQITAGHASSTITIGYPPFVGVFVASGSSSNPQVQAQQQEQQNGLGGGFGGFGGFGNSPGSNGQGSGQSCYSSDAGVSVPTTIAPVSSGTLVEGAICGSPAAAAGLTPGSVITAVNGKAVGAPSQLTGTLGQFHPGNTISITWVSPSGKRTTSSVHLVAGPPQ
jgi:S1-C subfamily serine protease